MESLHYLVLVNLYLLLFYGFYYLLLRNETFFRLNRLYLLSCAALSFLIPIIQFEWVKSLFITARVQEVNFIYSMMGTPAFTPVEKPTITTGDVLAIIYLTGLVIFFIRFIVHLINVRIHLTKSNTGKAFSFFKQIRVDSGLANHDVILEHEQVHARQLHSADVILFELIAIVNWFNPVVYFYKKAIKNIHEFTADEVAASYADSKNNYSLILLSNAFGVEPHQLTNSFFNQSLLKQRIYMLNKTKSRKAAILKYGLSAPLFAGMLILSSATIKDKVEASEQIAKLEPHNFSETVTTVIPKAITETLKSNLPISPKENSSSIVDQHTQLTSLDTLDKVQDFASVDILPEFPGGQEGFAKYIADNFNYSALAKEQGVSGKVILSFIVEKDGDLSHIKVLRDIGMGTGAEAVRILEESPKWKPGTQNGKLIRVNYTLPISLNLKVDGEESGIKIQPQNLNALYTLNGKEVKKDVINSLNPKSISSMNVLNDKSATDKYGEKGKNGVIEVTTYADVELFLTGKDLSEPLFKEGFFKGLVFIDGKEVDNSRGDVLSKLKPNEIKSIHVLRGDNVTKKYGENGKDGVVEVNMDTPVQKSF